MIKENFFCIQNCKCMEQLARNSNISRYNRHFQKRLDKFWQHKDILYDYKVELTGSGTEVR